jgi:hypothetical protein
MGQSLNCCTSAVQGKDGIAFDSKDSGLVTNNSKKVVSGTLPNAKKLNKENNEEIEGSYDSEEEEAGQGGGSN